MDTMLVVVFDTEAKAIEGRNALLELDGEGSINLFEHAIVTKRTDGTTAVKLADERGPLGTLAGTELGALIGLIAGPVGLATGAVVGLLAGSASDINKARINDDFVDDFTKQLQPGRFALVAEIDEGSTTSVDIRMAGIGGPLFRSSLSDVKHALHEEHVAAMQADLAEMKAEMAQARADRRVKLQEKINKLDSNIQEQLQKAKERRQAAERRDQAKAQTLKTETSALKGEAAENLTAQNRL